MSFAVLTRSGSSSSRYLAELCRSEGLTGHELIDLGRSAEPLAGRIADLSAVVVTRGRSTGRRPRSYARSP